MTYTRRFVLKVLCQLMPVEQKLCRGVLISRTRLPRADWISIADVSNWQRVKNIIKNPLLCIPEQGCIIGSNAIS